MADLESRLDDDAIKIRAIILAIKTGQRIQQDFPFFATLYREGETAEDLLTKYSIPQAYHINPKVAKTAIYCALRGSNGIFNTEQYGGLITDPEELEQLALQHQRAGGNLTFQEGKGLFALSPEQRREASRKAGLITHQNKTGLFGLSTEQWEEIHRAGGVVAGNQAYKQKTGIHAMTDEQRRELGSKYGKIGGVLGGKIGGKRSYEQKTGIHALTSEQRSANSRQSVLLRGDIPWVLEEKLLDKDITLPSEKDFILYLAALPHYQIRCKTEYRTRTSLIALELNRAYHNSQPIRNAQSVTDMLCNLRKLSMNL